MYIELEFQKKGGVKNILVIMTNFFSKFGEIYKLNTRQADKPKENYINANHNQLAEKQP